MAEPSACSRRATSRPTCSSTPWAPYAAVVLDCQNANKVPLLAVGVMEPVPWVPNILPVQIVKIGQFAIAVTNFETTTMAGRRIRDTVKTALSGACVTEVELAAISNAYAQYMTTKEEYLTQNYDGASTLFSPNQLAAVQQELARVAASVADSSVPLDVGPTPLQINRASLITLQTGVVLNSPAACRMKDDVLFGVNSVVFDGELCEDFLVHQLHDRVQVTMNEHASFAA